MAVAGPAQSAIDRLTQEAQASFGRFGLDPVPVVRVLTQEGFLQDGEWARSVIYQDGRCEIWLRPETLDLPDLPAVLDHESAHVKAWHLYGPGVEHHGRKWRKLCLKYAADPVACDEKRNR